MALTELQIPNKEEFYNEIQAIAGEMASRMARWKLASEFISKLDAADMDSMEIPSGQVRSDLSDFRTMIDEILSLWEGGSVTPANSPKEVCDEIRRMIVI